MAKKKTKDNSIPQFVGTREHLQVLADWIDQFVAATSIRIEERECITDIGELNKVLAASDIVFGGLNIVDAEDCRRLTRRMQKEVANQLNVTDLADLIEGSPSKLASYKRLMKDLSFAVPLFNQLGVDVRAHIKKMPPDKPRPKRGRKAASVAVRDREAKLAERWEAAKEARIHKADFAKDKGLKVKDLDRILSRVSKRKKRSSE